ncbi:hypothetical protein Q5P01_025477 [Channa striata]|uniref:Uncharacterized protein n=1 Tax=Channa striata TaxID=64152 RepID=A0AA88IPN1_CHASR|nr:hypothetical protein Q5P01_025477 [Channa striata]
MTTHRPHVDWEREATTEEQETDTHRTQAGHKSRRLRTDTRTRGGAAAARARSREHPRRRGATLRLPVCKVPLPDTTPAPGVCSPPQPLHHSAPCRLEDT